MHVPDELLRDRAAAAAILVEDLALDDAEHRTDVDAVVLVESLILDGDERLGDVPGQRLERNRRPRLVSDLADRRRIAREDERRLRQRDDLPCLAGLGRR